ncbi:MAG: acyltransferase [Candidatus Electrothrix sp. GW3-4]|uniref:acyltransferase family protein n=1 Tax=Candidatus Electrothrix sp. GW3-4 TaxID=3126740 RepID=UPI0030D2848F
MFGYYRFFLASLVLLSHLQVSLQGFNGGVAAVISFYMLAGFVVCKLLSSVFASNRLNYFRFIYERTLRIFPQYLFVVGLTIVFLLTTNFGKPVFNLVAFLNNLLIIPLNYSMFWDGSILQDPKWWLVPPAWSLGVELQAYLLLPLAIYFKPVKVVLSLLSLCIFILASFRVLHPHFFGYKLLPGVFFIFIIGGSIYRRYVEGEEVDFFDKYFPEVVYTLLVALVIILGAKGMLLVQFVRETILGVLIGMPIVIYLSKSTVKLPLNRFVGDLSYGLFLSHFLVKWLVENYSLVDRDPSSLVYLLTVFFFSLIFSIIGVFVVERPMSRYRFKLSSTFAGPKECNP